MLVETPAYILRTPAETPGVRVWSGVKRFREVERST